MPVLCLSQAGQDVFARYVIGRKGTFLDLGSFRPTYHNNTRVLELENWSGLSIDYQDFGQLIAYQNSSGQHYTTIIRQILSHLALHASHHRGQVVLLLKDHVDTLPTTDFIFFVR